MPLQAKYSADDEASSAIEGSMSRVDRTHQFKRKCKIKDFLIAAIIAVIFIVIMSQIAFPAYNYIKSPSSTTKKAEVTSASSLQPPTFGANRSETTIRTNAATMTAASYADTTAASGSVVAAAAAAAAVVPPMTDESKQAALQFVSDRREVYNTNGFEYGWKLRGIGYLYTSLKLVLLAQLPASPVLGETNFVTIRNVSNETHFTECSKLTIWVRVNGPEIFAGSAIAVMGSDNNECYWQFPFDLQIPGSYVLDVKLLMWNGKAVISGLQDGPQCQYKKGQNILDATLSNFRHDGFQGFKMYSAVQMCCEVCTRTPHCIEWGTPFLRIPEPSYFINGCELVFANDAPDSVIPKSHLWPIQTNTSSPRYNTRRRQLVTSDPMHGTPHHNPTSYFMGCGWSFWFTLDFPCISGDLDDRVYAEQSQFTVAPSVADPDEASQVETTTKLPLCTLDHENFDGPASGRWVRKTDADRELCQNPYSAGKPADKDFLITIFNDHPSCWHREDNSRIGNLCIEPNCAFIKKTSQWRSSIKDETDFFASWKPYKCDLLEFTSDQLQQCVTDRKIVSFQYMGSSVAEYLREFVNHRLSFVKLYDNITDPEALSVKYDTMSLLHKSNKPTGFFERQTAAGATKNVPPGQEHYFVSGMYLSSEREVHAHVGRMDEFNRNLRPILEQKGYKTINAFDVTAAFTYDVATQNDGMHFVGGSMKMIATKLFHHVCKDTVDGSVV